MQVWVCKGVRTLVESCEEKVSCARSQDRTAAALVLAGLDLQGNTRSFCEGFIDAAVLHS